MGGTVDDHLVTFRVVPYTPKIRFLASLSDGRTVIQDDRPHQEHAWLRFKNWLNKNQDINVTELRLQGPNGIDIKTPQHANGYFFGNKYNAVWGGGQNNYVGLGYYDGNTVNIVWHKKPNFSSCFTEEKTPQQAGQFLIRNKA